MRSSLLKTVSAILLAIIVICCPTLLFADEGPRLLISSQTTTLIEVTPTGEPSIFVDGLPGDTEAIAFDAAGDLYVVVMADGARILKIDARTKAIVGNYLVGSERIFGLAIRGSKAYTVGPYTDGILVVDLVSGGVSVLNDSFSAYGLQFGPDGMLYCQGSQINPETGAKRASAGVSWDFRFDASGNMYGAVPDQRRILRISPGADGYFGTDAVFGNSDDHTSVFVQSSDSIGLYGLELFDNQLFFSTNGNLASLNLTNGVLSVNTNVNTFIKWIAQRPVPNDVAGTIQLENVLYDVREGDGDAVVSLVRTGGSEGAVTVNFRTHDGSAKDGQDFVGKDQVVLFEAGETQKTVVIPIVNDGFAETTYLSSYDVDLVPSTDYFSVYLSDPAGGTTLGIQVRATITIEDNDGEPNLLWRHQDGRLAIWEMDGTNKVAKYLLNDGKPISLMWRFAALGDMNQDGRTDFLWQRNDGVVAGWLMNGTNISGKFWLNDKAPISWKLLNAADWNQDSNPDLLWQHPDGRIALWYMNQTNRVSTRLIHNGTPVASSWRFAGAVDIRKKGVPAIVWSNTDGRVGAWVMDRTTDGFTRVENYLFRDEYAPDGSGWIHRGFSSFFLLPLIDSQLYQNVNRQVALVDSSVWPHQTLYLNNGVPVAPGWKLLGHYPRSN